MLNLFARSRRDARSVKSSFRPTLEKLEDRDCPSTVNLFIVSYAAGKQVTVGGAVSDTPSPGGLTVQLTLLVLELRMRGARSDRSRDALGILDGGEDQQYAPDQCLPLAERSKDPTCREERQSG